MKKHWKIWLIFLVLFLAYSGTVIFKSLLKPDATCAPQATTVEISEDELTRFLEAWPNFIAADYNQDMASLKLEKATDQLSWRAKYWLGRRCWTPERFLYIEERLNQMLQALYLRQHADAVISILEEELVNEKDEHQRVAYQNMIEAQKQIGLAGKISENELEMTERHLAEIRNVLMR